MDGRCSDCVYFENCHCSKYNKFVFAKQLKCCEFEPKMKEGE